MDKSSARTLRISTLALAMALIGCSSRETPAVPAASTKISWGNTPEGQPVELYTLTNAKGSEARIMTYGGVVVSLKVPDRSGALGDVVAGFDNLQGYLTPPPYFGAIIGRYGNRIGGGQFSLGGVAYTLAKNDGANHLHGGVRGFDKRVWSAKQLSPQSLELSYLSKDGEEGYPGNLSATVTYTLTDAHELRIEYSATTDKETVVNLTNHSYFNLAGEGDILGHQVVIHADRFTPVDKGLIPTGELKSVAGTPFDFLMAKTIGERIEQKDEQLIRGRGYDHNWVLNRTGPGLETARAVRPPPSIAPQDPPQRRCPDLIGRGRVLRRRLNRDAVAGCDVVHQEVAVGVDHLVAERRVHLEHAAIYRRARGAVVIDATTSSPSSSGSSTSS